MLGIDLDGDTTPALLVVDGRLPQPAGDDHAVAAGAGEVHDVVR
ncbi:hypothetical protein ACWDR2_34705 [Streptomyces sp. NPDC003631]